MPNPAISELKFRAAKALCEFAVAPSQLPVVVRALVRLVSADAGAITIGHAGHARHTVYGEAGQTEAALPVISQDAWAMLPPGQIHRIQSFPPALAGPSGREQPMRGFADACIARLETDDGLTVELCLALKGEPGSGAFQTSALAALGECMPMLRSTIAAQRRHLAMQALGFAIMNRYDRYHVGAMVVDADGYLIYRNEAARRHLDPGSGLVLREGRLEAGLPAESALLLQSIRDVLDSDLPDSHFLSRLFGASREGEMPLTLAISPFRGEPGIGRYVTIMAYDPSRPDVNRKEVIQWTYHLNVRESELACALAGGESLETYAGRADCSLESARSLLKRIFRKTGTSRQSELVKLVLAGPAAMVQ